MTVWVYTTSGARFVYDASDNVADGIARYNALMVGQSDAPAVVAAMVVGNDDDGPEVMAAIDIVGRTERYSVRDNDREDWIA